MNCKFAFTIFSDVITQRLSQIGHIDMSCKVTGELEMRADSSDKAKEKAIEMMHKMTPKGMKWQLHYEYCTYSSDMERVGKMIDDVV